MEYTAYFLKVMALVIGIIEFTLGFLSASGFREKIYPMFEKSKFLQKLWGCDYCLSFWIGALAFGLTFIPYAELFMILPAAVGWYWILSKKS